MKPGAFSLNRYATRLRRWFKCHVRRLHFYKFVEKYPTGVRLLVCVRCGRRQYTNPRSHA